MPALTQGRSAARGSGRWTRRILLLLVFGALAYGLSLLVTLPTKVAARYAALPPQVEALGGTVWNGSALIEGGHRVTWRLARMKSLVGLAPRFDVTVNGPGTALDAQAVVSPVSQMVTVEGLRGRASWSLAAAFATDAPPLECDPVALLDIERIALSRNRVGAVGVMRSTEGVCRRMDRPAAAPIPVPSMILQADMAGDSTRATLERRDAGNALLAEAVLAEGRRLDATLLPEGLRLIPGLPNSAPFTIEMDLPFLTALPRQDR